MNRLSQSGAGGFAQGFAHGGMSMDGPVDVLQGEFGVHREGVLRNQFGGVLSYDMGTEKLSVAGIRQDLDKPVRVI